MVQVVKGPEQPVRESAWFEAKVYETEAEIETLRKIVNKAREGIRRAQRRLRRLRKLK